MHAEPSADQAIDTQLEQALTLHRAKQFEQAEQAYLAILALRRHHPTANHALGLLLGQMERHAAALPYFEAAWSVNPDEGQFWLSYAGGLLKAQQPARALELMQTAVARGLDNEAAQGLLAAALAAEAEHASGNPSYEEKQQLGELYRAGQNARLEQAARQLQEKYPASAFVSSVLGTALQLQGKDALAVLRRTVQLAPGDAEAHSSLGNALQGAGAYQEAVASYRQALRLQPDFAEAHSNLGAALQALGQPEQAAHSYRQAILVRPDYASAHFNLANTLRALGDFAGTVDSYRSVVQLVPDDVEAHAGLGDALRELGRHDEAAASFQRALALQPDSLQLMNSLADSLLAAGELAQASSYYQQALVLQPASMEAHLRVGISLQMQEKYELALASLEKAVELDRGSLPAHVWLAHTQIAAGHSALAADSYRAALALSPDNAALHNQLGIALHNCKDFDAALAAYRQALALQPDMAQAHCNIGVTQNALKRNDEACVSYRQALALDPQFAPAHFNLGIALRAMHQMEEAAKHYRLARDAAPDHLDAHINLCSTLSEMGELVQTIEASRAALAIHPDCMPVYQNMLFCLSHMGTTDPAVLYQEHLRFAAQFEGPFLSQWPRHDNPPDPQRVLRVGFVSGDFYHHAVSNFVIPIFEHLCRSPRLSLYAYYSNTEIDDATERVRDCIGNWREVAALNDAQLTQLIRDDGIDVLIDLSGHTNKNRLMTFARKPAPLQATWIGYPGTTGLQSIDYFLTDSHLLPPAFASQFSEQFAYLPASAPFLPSAESPPLNPLPALRNGYVTFGSFNRPNKLSQPVIALWSRLMHAVPGSRLLLGAMPLSGEHDVFIDWFAGEGIGLDRLSFAPRGPMKDYLKLHHQVDICLDTFPYTGGTTTLHSLWMGVPMLTVAGATMPGRVSAAVLEQLKLDAMVARDGDDFVQKGVYLANALPLLETLRGSMRDLLANSAVGQPGVIAVGLEGALRVMWQRWCAGLPPVSFEVELDPEYAGEQEA